MHSLKLYALATAAAVMAACAVAGLPALAGGEASEGAAGPSPAAAAFNSNGKYLDNPYFKPIHVGH